MRRTRGGAGLVARVQVDRDTFVRLFRGKYSRLQDVSVNFLLKNVKLFEDLPTRCRVGTGHLMAATPVEQCGGAILLVVVRVARVFHSPRLFRSRAPEQPEVT